jgi:Tol biopolymer transport system component
VARYDGYIRGLFSGGGVSRSTIKIVRARDGWYWDGWQFSSYAVELPLSLGYHWEFPFRPDYGLYIVTVEVVTTEGYHLETTARLALQVKTQEIVYQSARNGNTDIFRAENRGFVVGEVRLTDNAAYDGAPVFSPDHKFVAFESNRDGNFEIYVMDSAYGRTLYRITNNAADDRAPSWSPDGKFLVFHSNRDGNYEIYATGFPYGRDLYRLTNNAADDMYPSWSPDGKYIAFQSSREQGKPQIYETTFPYGTSTYRLGRFSGANDTTPSFSPDGLFLAFSSTRSGNNDIFLIDTDYGNSVYQVTRATTADTNPVWTPYCDALYYQSDNAGVTSIFQAFNPFYGRDIRRLTLDPISILLRGLGIP